MNTVFHHQLAVKMIGCVFKNFMLVVLKLFCSHCSLDAYNKSMEYQKLWTFNTVFDFQTIQVFINS